MAKDVINRTEGLRRQAQEIIEQAYCRGYKDGEADGLNHANQTCYGYPVEELLAFGLACKRAGVTNEELSWFIHNTEIIWDTVAAMYAEQANKEFRKAIKEMSYAAGSAEKAEE
ncbi:MAG: hypothetical protein IKG83_03240 [Prevotella sp.]|nr:hypothetical protein [Prevotella sp.]